MPAAIDALRKHGPLGFAVVALVGSLTFVLHEIVTDLSDKVETLSQRVNTLSNEVDHSALLVDLTCRPKEH